MSEDNFFESESIGASWGHIKLEPEGVNVAEALERRKRFEKLLYPVCHSVLDIRV